MRKNARVRNTPDAPTAYAVAQAHRTRDDQSEEAKAGRSRAEAELESLHERQKEIIAQRELEQAESGWSDFRDPLELDIDDIPRDNKENLSFDEITDGN